MDDPILITGGLDSNVIFWKAHEGIQYKSLPIVDSHLNQIHIAPDNSTLATCGDRFIRFYSLYTHQKAAPNPLLCFEGHKKNVTSIGFENNGNWFFSASEDGTLKIWDLRDSKIQLDHDNEFCEIHTATLFPDQGTIVYGDQQGKIQFWDMRADSIRQILAPQRNVPVNTLAISSDGLILAAATHAGSLHIWNEEVHDVAHQQPRQSIMAHNGKYVLKVRFSPDISCLATASSDGTCCIWERNQDEFSKKATYTGHTRWVWDCAFSNDGAYIVTASSDSTCKLWEVSSGQNVLNFIGSKKGITTMALLDIPMPNSNCLLL